MELRGRAALVTGAGRRVGRAIALALGAQGMHVGVHYGASAAGARETAAEIERAGGRATCFPADLTEPDSPAALIDAAVGRLGRLDVLVNSAAVMVRTPVGNVTPAAWDEMFALNLRAPFFAAQAAAPHLAREQGAIVNLADLAAFETWPGYVPHGITKAGVVQMTRALARTLAPDVRVNAVAPGTVLLPESWPDDAAERLAATTPLRRLGSPDDVTRTILFLLASDYITGETIIVDGGRHVRR
ncbi:MAG: SDR family oxidoreductase [Gemmatimonadaceae bacterium]